MILREDKIESQKPDKIKTKKRIHKIRCANCTSNFVYILIKDVLFAMILQI